MTRETTSDPGAIFCSNPAAASAGLGCRRLLEPGRTAGRRVQRRARRTTRPRSLISQPRAKSVISLFMSGGVSHVDTFDPKPALNKYAGQPLTGKGDVVVRQGHPGPLMPSPFQFRKYGQSGIDVSEIFPHMASHVDELAVLRSVFSKSNDHVQAHYALASGMIRMGFPSVGSWITYGLGSESQSLPAFVVIYDRARRTIRRPVELERRLHARRAIRARSSARPARRSSI